MTPKIDAEKVFRELADVLAHSGSADFYVELVKKLEDLLQVDHVLLAEISADGQEAKTLAVTSHGKTIHNFTYPLRGTPCEAVEVEKPCLINGGVVAQFPQDEMLAALNAESYLGMAIVDGEGRRVGLLSILQDSKMTWPDLGREVLRIAVAQIGAEMIRQESHYKIHQLAYQDTLTKLPNRIRLQEYIAESVATAYRTQSSVGIIIIDIRRFKEINDTHGHQAGDKLLAAVALRLQNLLGEEIFIARQSSDEYTIVLRNTSQLEVGLVVDKVRKGFADPFAVGARRFFVEINVGAALYPEDSDTAGELFQHASIALDEAKLEGLDHCIYDATMAEKLHRKQLLLNRLAEAIRSQKLHLCYQPQLCLHTGALKGAEALCRWHDEKLGEVSPAEFIPLAEERGLIRELGAWVVTEGSQQMRAWQEKTGVLPWRLSINLSAQQFDDARIVDDLVEFSKPMGAQSLLLELTESVMMRDPLNALETSSRLANAGFAMAIDDFGTGYSSLAYLQRLRLQEIKIDRSFIFKLEESEQDRSIVAAIIALAKGLKLKTVAEGVETQGQVELLRELGCDYAQGYFLGRPVPAKEFYQAWLVREETA